jgi:inhibitor of KinA sporulation pathway (predicted exonuclease)/ribosomal protein S27E
MSTSSLPPPPAATGATASASAALFAGANRLAVVDVETTGLYSSDRVVEVAVVTLDSAGVVVDEFETLVNPGRDVGPTWLHQVTASMVADAPTFDEVAQHVASRLDGAVIVAHNLPFDRRMLDHEFARARITVDWGDGLDTLQVTGCKLGVACTEHGIRFDGDAHSALADARATAQLLARLAHQFPTSGRIAAAYPLEVTPIRVHTRAGTAQADVPAPYLAALARGVHAAPDVASYLDLLDVVIADLKVTAGERAQLADLAGDLGLDSSRIARAHREFVNGLIDAALEDAVMTDEEYDLLCRAAALLEVDPDVVARRTDGHRSATDTITLTPGTRICFTGAAVNDRGRPLDRSYLEDLARDRGLVPTRDVSASGCDVLVAADPASRSGKASKAHKFAVPIVSVSDFLSIQGPGASVPATTFARSAVALVCTRCGDSWLATRSSSKPMCATCKGEAEPTPRPTPAATTEPPSRTIETLICESCGRTWQRERSRGRKPHRCPSCR